MEIKDLDIEIRGVKFHVVYEYRQEEKPCVLQDMVSPGFDAEMEVIEIYVEESKVNVVNLVNTICLTSDLKEMIESKVWKEEES